MRCGPYTGWLGVAEESALGSNGRRWITGAVTTCPGCTMWGACGAYTGWYTYGGAK